MSAKNADSFHQRARAAAEQFAENWCKPSPEKAEHDALSHAHQTGYHAALRDEVVANMAEALKWTRDELEEGGAYLVESGFEEPWHCRQFRIISERLAAYESALAAEGRE